MKDDLEPVLSAVIHTAIYLIVVLLLGNLVLTLSKGLKLLPQVP